MAVTAKDVQRELKKTRKLRKKYERLRRQFLKRQERRHGNGR